MFNSRRSREIPATGGITRYLAGREKSATTARGFKTLFKTPSVPTLSINVVANAALYVAAVNARRPAVRRHYYAFYTNAYFIDYLSRNCGREMWLDGVKYRRKYR